eukprot:gene9924-10941_t
MSSKRPAYIPPPTTTFIMGNKSKSLIRRPNNNNESNVTGTANPHWNNLRERMHRGKGFSVPDDKYFSASHPKSQGQERMEKTINAMRQSKDYLARKHQPKDRPGTRNMVGKRPQEDNDSSTEKNGNIINQQDELMTISKQTNHFSAPDRIFDFTNDDEDQNYHSNSDSGLPTKVARRRSSNDELESTSLNNSSLNRRSSVYDPKEMWKRIEMLAKHKDKLADYVTENGVSERKRMVEDDNSARAIGTNDGSIHNQEGNKTEMRKKTFFDKCAPSFVKKVLDAIEKKKSDCLMNLDEIASKCKRHVMEKGEPVFTSYSCENQDGGGGPADFKSSLRNRVSNLLGGFYTRACSGMQVKSDFSNEKEQVKDGTHNAPEEEYGVRDITECANTVPDFTIYICSCCFNEECDRDVFVNTSYLDEIYGCMAPVFVTRSFENRPAHCEKMLARLNKQQREMLLKIAGKKCEMKAGVRCCSKVKLTKEEQSNNDETVMPD